MSVIDTVLLSSIETSMKFLIVPRRVLGVAIPKEQLRDVQPVSGDIVISECHNEDLGRSSVSAQVYKTNSGPDILPPLLDVRITGMAQNGMSLSGVEKVGDAFYAQSWWCRVE
jgi:hypothetical protein